MVFPLPFSPPARTNLWGLFPVFFLFFPLQTPHCRLGSRASCLGPSTGRQPCPPAPSTHLRLHGKHERPQPLWGGHTRNARVLNAVTRHPGLKEILQPAFARETRTSDSAGFFCGGPGTRRVPRAVTERDAACPATCPGTLQSAQSLRCRRGARTQRPHAPPAV